VRASSWFQFVCVPSAFCTAVLRWPGV
jgi:hypothetical protein